MDILVLLSLVVLNGVFAMSEIALITAKKAKLANKYKEGNRSAKIAMELGEDPNKLLSTVQIGITSIGILSGIVGESVLSVYIKQMLIFFGVGGTHIDYLSTVIVVVLITYFSIVIGELVPKRIGQMNPERIACFMARIMQLLATVASPFVSLLSLSTHAILSLLRIKQDNPHSSIEEDIHYMLDEGANSGVIELQENRMVKNVFHLDDRQISSVMVPRSNVVYLDIALSLEENIQRIQLTDFSKYPVTNGGLGTILGVITAQQLLKNTYHHSGNIDLFTGIQAPVFLPETITGMALLQQFKAFDTQLAFVVDEYGDLQGIVTQKDIIEAIAGEFKSPNEEAWITLRSDGSWLVDGLVSAAELRELLDLRKLPQEDEYRYHTLAGLIMLLLGKIPHTGDKCQWQNIEFEVVDMDGTKIDKVLITKS
ncbi:hemolysin family protein [Plesiomonas sp.]|uniref:hemolysin family protein n=1 Tax=Plesiomonas sp. TaxID=2486279 RepID=UPI003F3F6FBA